MQSKKNWPCLMDHNSPRIYNSGWVLPCINLSKRAFINGIFKIVPIMGSLRANAITIGKKSPNKLTNPNTSTINPTKAHPTTTRNIPTTKHDVPRNFLRWKKNRPVFFSPSPTVTPDKNNRFPIANSPLSKNIKTPRNVKNIPNPVSNTPIFC